MNKLFINIVDREERLDLDLFFKVLFNYLIKLVEDTLTMFGCENEFIKRELIFLKFQTGITFFKEVLQKVSMLKDQRENIITKDLIIKNQTQKI